MLAARLPVMMYLHLESMLMIVSEGWLGRAEYSGKRCERQGDFFISELLLWLQAGGHGPSLSGRGVLQKKSPR
jgi:hypothetical protein